MEFCNIWRYLFSQTDPISELFINASLQLCVLFWALLFLSDHLYFYDVYLSRSYWRRCLYSLPVLQKKKIYIYIVQNFNFLDWMLGNKGEFKMVSVQSSHSVVSNSLWPYGLQLARPPCPSPIPRACSISYPSSQWCHPTISFFVVPLSSCLQSFPASASFPMSQFFTSGSQKYWSFNFNISPSTEYSGLISFMMVSLGLLAVQGTLKTLLQHHS